MKTRVIDRPVEEVLSLPAAAHHTPVPQSAFMRRLMTFLSSSELRKVHFSCEKTGMEKLPPGEPALFLMNHSSFIDLKIASVLLKDRPWHVICTLDGFVGKERLMRSLGCIPTRKFITDVALVQDMIHTTKKLRESVLLFPEAGYSFDGTATPLPDSLGKCIRLLRVPVVMIRTFGAFTRDPLYNGLRLRDVPVSACMKYLFSAEDVARMKPDEINAILRREFTFDHFLWQQENHIRVNEGFRAEGLERVLYKCPVCGQERQMKGSGTDIVCGACRAAWRLTEYGALERLISGTTADPIGFERAASPASAPAEPSPASPQVHPDETPEAMPRDFTHVPDWYRWERDCVRRELGKDGCDENIPVEIMILADTKALYRVGDGILHHGMDGFVLTGCDGKLEYRQGPTASYTLNADYFWYEIGDILSVGDSERQYYCFPKDRDFPVAKERLITEELYKLKKGR